MLAKIGANGNKRWVLKRKFAMAGTVLIILSLATLVGLKIAIDVAEVSVVMTTYAATTGGVLTLIFAADITDKKLNGGQYHAIGESGEQQ
ncbi:MAG: hypothetical protein GY927_15525 [bacterium]|nr:hypothetical protein [bacterium]